MAERPKLQESAGILNFQRRTYLPAKVSVCLSGNALALINVVALRQARLVLGWVTVRGYYI